MEPSKTRRWPLGQVPEIVTERLRLRAPATDDMAAIARLANDWEIARRMARLPHPYGIEDARFFIDEIAPNELAWAITSLGDGALLGIAGLVPDASADEAELGYWLGRAHWGRGFATEAARAIVDYGFGTLGLPLLTSGCFVDNVGSRGVLAKIGFEEASLDKRPSLAVGGDLPFIAMKLVRPTPTPPA